ncbi:MAG: hypothetical protein IKW20_05800 [Bacteroidales bacterium]|nr:hypothetical protein [Bacteroidales bacterium]
MPRLIDADAMREDWLENGENEYVYDTNAVLASIDAQPTVDAVEADDMREFAEDVACQFGYYCQNEGRLHITHGGLSTLEWAFDILGWDNPHPVPEFECEIEGCHEHATCGTPTADGYKRMCSKHYRNHCAKMDGDGNG